jgi:hypothetical protein
MIFLLHLHGVHYVLKLPLPEWHTLHSMVRVAASLIWANQVLSDEVQTDFMIQLLAMKRDPRINKARRYICDTFIMGIRMVDGGWGHTEPSVSYASLRYLD